MSDLTVVTVVENDRGLLDLMIESVYKFTNPAPRILICENGNDNATAKYGSDPNITIIRNAPKLGGGSNRHGDALNKALAKVDTSRTAIIESDCIVLTYNWDKIKSQYKMVAAKKGKSANLILYHACFMVFYTDILKHVDFRPGKDGKRANRPYKPHEDVAWQVGLKVKPNDVHEMTFVDCKSGKGIYFDGRFQSDELWLDSKPVVAHFGRGSNIAGKAIRKGFKHPSAQLDLWMKKAKVILNE